MKNETFCSSNSYKQGSRKYLSRGVKSALAYFLLSLVMIKINKRGRVTLDKQPRTLTPEQMAKMKKMGKFFGWIFGILLVVGLLFLLTFNWITDYIWLD